MSKLRVGVVGAGYLGKFHAEKYARMEGVDFAGVADVDKNAAQKIAAQFGTASFVNYKDLFNKVDAVSIVTPTPLHYALSKEFLEHDIHVLIEKPITTSLEEADELIGISKSRDLTVQVGHLERFNPAIVSIKGVVSEPRFIESHRLSTFKERGTDVSVVLDLMIHDIDIILNHVDSEVTGLHAAGTAIVSPNVDIANARLEFASGCVATLTASRVSFKNERKMRFFQRDGYVSVNFADHRITAVRKTARNTSGPIPGMELKETCFDKSDALDDELKSFVTAVKTRKAPVVTGKMGRDALEIALAVTEKIASAD